ncbi:aldolase [candidate division KSB1 bacterium]|nr:aldolase [candidate division KSB1 bacterium]
MRPSRVLKKLRAGKVVCSFKNNFADTGIIEVAAMAGFDCIWLCSEHIPRDWDVLRAQILAAKVHNVDVVVRTARGSYSDYIKPFELDATGIMVPHVTSAADAANVVQMTRFHPIGQRAVDGGNADGAYCNLPLKEYIKQSNEQRFIILQIEDPEPLDELDEIAALDGIDMLLFGPGDFSHRIGAIGEWTHPKLIKARKRVADAALKHGKFAGTVTDMSNLEELVDMGFSFLNIGGDVGAMNQYCQDRMADFLNRTS